MFVTDEWVLAVNFGASSARLAELAHGGWLRSFLQTVHDGDVECPPWVIVPSRSTDCAARIWPPSPG
jgi:hypothetical protein